MGKSKDLATGAAYQDQTESDARYANVTGDTFTGLVNITNTYSSDTTEQLRVSDNTGSKLDFFGHANGTKSIQAYADDGSTFYNLNLQPLGGGVTMPNQPGFQADGNFGWRDYADYTVVPNWRTTVAGQHNIGNHFNHNTGVFTCPIAGRYLINITVYVNNSGDTAHVGRIGRNGAYWGDNAFTYQNSDTGYPDNSMSASYIMNASVNDTMTYYHKGDIYGYHTNWSVYLLG